MDNKLQSFFFMDPGAGRSGGSSTDPEIRRLATEGQALSVVMDAAHSAYLNKNYFFMPPSVTQKFLSSWIKPYNKPVQVHHDDHSDPIGRVVKAEFVSYTPTDTVNNNFDKALTLLNAMDCSDKKGLVNQAQELYKTGLLSDPEWKGLGAFRLHTEITDNDAAQKFLDRRYLTVSIGQSAEEVTCSVCGNSPFSEDCEHRRGQEYTDADGKNKMLCFWIISETEGLEVSPVNKPADEEAQVKQISILRNSLDDSLQDEYVVSVVSTLPVLEYSMDLISEEPQESEKVEEEKTEDSPAEKVLSIEEILAILFENENDFTEDYAEKINEEMEEMIESAKLNKEARDKLAPSVFCGPNRSFPVNDCAHYTAAKRMIGRYTGAGDKSKISACIERKGKALGCPGAESNLEEEETISFIEPTDIHLTMKSTEELKSLYDSYKEILEARGVDLTVPCSNCESLIAQIASLAEEIVTSNSTISNLENTLTVLRKEYSLLSFDYGTLISTSASSLVEAKNQNDSILITLIKILDSDLTDEQIQTSIQEKSSPEIIAFYSEKIEEKKRLIEIGVEKEPEKKIEFNNEENAQNNLTDEEKNIKSYVKVAMYLKDRSGKVYADQYLTSLIESGKIEKTITLAKCEEIMAKYPK